MGMLMVSYRTVLWKEDVMNLILGPFCNFSTSHSIMTYIFNNLFNLYYEHVHVHDIINIVFWARSYMNNLSEVYPLSLMAEEC